MPLAPPNSGSCAEIEFRRKFAGRIGGIAGRKGCMSRTLRVLVTGQSPRPDVEAQVTLEAPGIEFRLSGTLDGMSRADINGSAWRCSDADILPAKLASGRSRRSHEDW
jgi:hypothetical protein